MSTLPGLESFELVSDESKTRVPLSGALLGWSDDVQHRLNEHAILQRSGSIHQSQGQGPRRFVFRCLLREPGASDTYKRVEALLGREPFATLLHPRFSRVPVVFVGLKVAEDMEARTSGMIVELSLCETGLREVKADSASAAARQASQATAQAVSLTQALPALAPLSQALAAQASAAPAGSDTASMPPASKKFLATLSTTVDLPLEAIPLKNGMTCQLSRSPRSYSASSSSRATASSVRNWRAGSCGLSACRRAKRRSESPPSATRA